jgi:TolA-binding protein
MAPQHYPANSAAVSELQSSLATETRLRLAAEKKLEELNGEIEDLSTTLFEQANEMVATERREKAKLLERVRVLEGRGVEGKKRLEMVESALERLERVRKLLDE